MRAIQLTSTSRLSGADKSDTRLVGEAITIVVAGAPRRKLVAILLFPVDEADVTAALPIAGASGPLAKAERSFGTDTS
jgi:hypothetical protein